MPRLMKPNPKLVKLMKDIVWDSFIEDNTSREFLKLNNEQYRAVLVAAFREVADDLVERGYL